jgi:hypothetical protein
VCVSLTNEGLASDIAAAVREEIDGRIRNIANMSKAAQGLGLGVGSLGVGWEQTFQALEILSDFTPAENKLLVISPLSGRWDQGR